MISGVLLFAMVFTVGSSYFLYIISSNGQYANALATRAALIQDQLQENLQVNAIPGTTNNLTLTITNLGGLAVNAVALFVTDPSGTLHDFGTNFTTNTTPALPMPVSVGKTTKSIDTGISVQAGTYVVKVLTQRGSAFSATYPPSGQNLAAYALSSGAIGDLYMTFTDYKSWSVTTGGCSNAGDFSGYCLTSPTDAFSVPANFKCYGSTYCNIFSVRVTDLNKDQAVIQLDQFSLFYQLYEAGPNGKAGYYPWFIISNSSGNIYKHFHVINLTYNAPQTIVFGAASCIQANSGPNLSICTSTITGTNWLLPQGTNCGSVEPCGQVGVSFINANGWELPSISATKNLAYSGINYAQNLPFVSTLYL